MHGEQWNGKPFFLWNICILGRSFYHSLNSERQKLMVLMVLMDINKTSTCGKNFHRNLLFPLSPICRCINFQQCRQQVGQADLQVMLTVQSDIFDSSSKGPWDSQSWSPWHLLVNVSPVHPLIHLVWVHNCSVPPDLGHLPPKSLLHRMNMTNQSP